MWLNRFFFGYPRYKVASFTSDKIRQPWPEQWACDVSLISRHWRNTHLTTDEANMNWSCTLTIWHDRRCFQKRYRGPQIWASPITPGFQVVHVVHVVTSQISKVFRVHLSLDTTHKLFFSASARRFELLGLYFASWGLIWECWWILNHMQHDNFPRGYRHLPFKELQRAPKWTT